MIKFKNMLIILSGPSGVGKNTVFNNIKTKCKNFYKSISMTTRIPRSDEINGLDYYFVDKKKFNNFIDENKFLEYVEYCGNKYGTLYSEVDVNLKKNKDVILIVETHGGLQIKNKWLEYSSGVECISIYILPPEFDKLRERLFKRGEDDEEIIKKRIINAKKEIDESNYYDYHIINDDVEKCSNKILEIIEKEKINLRSS